MKLHLNYIGGARTAASGDETLPMIDPSTGAVFAQIPRGTPADIDAAVLAARAAFDGEWGRLPGVERGRVLARAAALVLANADELTAIEAQDCGKPTAQARADVLAIARYFEFYGGAADKVGGQMLPYLAGYTVLAERAPHGVTGHIIPWNYPLQIFGRSVGAALAAGNACVVKPAEDACLSLLRVAELLAEAGLPAGALNIVCGLGREAGTALAAHAGLDHISFTGSPATGVQVTQAAAANHVPVTLELGGKSPQLVFDDADLDAAVPVIVNAIVQNSGQTCSAGSRLLAQRGVYEALLGKLRTAFEALQVGPASANPSCGPLIRASQLAHVRQLVGEAQGDGVQIAAQGRIAADAPAGGFYFAPTLLRDVPPTHRIAQVEVFGPVLAAMAFDTEAEAIALANGSAFGLVAGVWTKDGSRALRVAKRLRCGQVFVNNYGAGGGVELPFGGVKASGHGREKGIEGLLSFTQIKTIAIKHD